MNFATGAAYLVQTLTAYYGMSMLGDMQKGQTLLIHSVAGGVGLQALKIAKAMDCYVVGTVGSPASRIGEGDRLRPGDCARRTF